MSRKRKTVKIDRCRPLREQLEQNEAEIRDVEDALTDPDILESIKRRLRVLLGKLRALHARLVAALRACEALPAGPPLRG